MNTSIEPKGTLVAIGGSEDKVHDLTVLREVISLINQTSFTIEVITTASEFPEDTGGRYIEAFGNLCDCKVNLMNISEREEASQKKNLERIKKASLIFFSGGDQLRLTTILGGTELLKKVVEKYYTEDCVIAGTSAGATAMSQSMIYGGESAEALLKGTVYITTGIGLIENVVIDSHFITRGRFSRLMEVITSNPSHIGVGLGEDTGVIIRKGHLMHTIGNGLVVIFEGKNIRHTNITNIGYGDAIAVENMHIHTLVDGYGYDLREEKFLKPQEMEASKQS